MGRLCDCPRQAYNIFETPCKYTSDMVYLKKGKAREAALPSDNAQLNALQRQPSLLRVVAAIFSFPYKSDKTD